MQEKVRQLTPRTDAGVTSFHRPEELIDDIRRGKMVVLLDDEDRENEGDLVMAASFVRPEDINFMARYGRGLICLTLTRERCEELGLRLMVGDHMVRSSTNFTISVDAAVGITTGISASDRARTIQAAAATDAKPSDFVQPGHIFPLMAEPGGVLARAGHTEAGCDLARLAGQPEAAVIVEILKEDGTMARRADLEAFAAEHELKIGTIADLIHHRMLHEKTVERVAECNHTTQYGEFRLISYRDIVNQAAHLALVKGDIKPEEPTLIRVHVQNSLTDLTGSRRDDSGWPLADALRRVAEEEVGAVVILRYEEPASDIIHQVETYAQQDAGVDLPTHEHSEKLTTYGVGAQILIDLGVRRMRVLSAPKKMHAISGFGLEVVEYVS